MFKSHYFIRTFKEMEKDDFPRDVLLNFFFEKQQLRFITEMNQYNLEFIHANKGNSKMTPIIVESFLMENLTYLFLKTIKVICKNLLNLSMRRIIQTNIT